MAESLGTAVLDLSVDDSGLDKGLGSAESTTKSRMGKIGGVVAKGAKVAGAGLLAAGGAAVAGAVKTAAYGDELDKTSSKLGVHTDFLQDAQHWASQNGISAQSMERGVGRLNQRIGRAIDGNEKYAEAFEDVGVELKDQQGNIRDTDEVMRDTIDSLQGIEDPAQRSAAASEIFGTKMARDLMPALEDGSLSLEDATEAMDEHGRMTEDQIASSVEFTDAWDNIKTAGMSLLRDAFTPVMGFLADKLFPFVQDNVVPALQTFGEWLGPKLQTAAEGVTTFFEERALPVLAMLSDWWDTHGPTIIQWAQRIGGFLSAQWVPVLGAIAALVAGALTVSIIGLIGSLAALFTPVNLIIAGIALLAAGLTYAYQNSETFRDVVDSVFSWLRDFIPAAIDTVRDVIAGFVSWAIDFWAKWGDTILDVASAAWGAIRDLIKAALRIVKGILDVFIGVFTGDWSRAWEGVKNIFGGMWDAIVGIVRNLGPLLVSLIQAAMRKIVSAVRTGGSNMLSFMRSLPGRILRALGNVNSLLFSAGKRIIEGLIRGIKNMIGKVGDAIGSVASKVRDALPFSPAKEGPLSGSGSPDLAGERIAEMLGEGMESARLSGSIAHMLPDLGAFDLGDDGGALEPIDLTLDLGEGITQRYRIERTREGQARAVRLGAS